jgi:catalase-peroxidase
MHGEGQLPRPTQGDANQFWWPNRLNLKVLAKHSELSNPQSDLDYKAKFEALDLDAVKADIRDVMLTSQDWWPADFGSYAGLFVRVAWHSAGTYRVQDGRGGGGTGQQRFAPINSWPDNVLTDQGRRLLWPVKKKYGQSLSWGDLMILAGNVALEEGGLKTFGFAGGRPDVFEADDDVYWGPETEWLDNPTRYAADRSADSLEDPLAAVQMGLIYVNPEGVEGDGDPVRLAGDIKTTFGRMGMSVEETVALIAGGHTFGKTHGNAPADAPGPVPEAAPLEQQGLGWKSDYKSGKGIDAIGSGLEVTWTYHPLRWDNEFFHILYGYEWEIDHSLAGGMHYKPKDNGGAGLVPEADGSGTREPRMLVSDMSLRVDPEMDKISRKFKDDQAAFSDAFARAWFKLTHRDMGPKARYLGKEVPAEDLIWQDPVPAGKTLSDAEVATLKDAIKASGLSVAQLVSAAWSSASTFRSSDKRGGANGARIALEPQRSWEVNVKSGVNDTVDALKKIAEESGTGASLADTIVLAGNVGVELAAEAAGTPVEVPFHSGRGDATQEQTDTESFSYLEPKQDGFRNYFKVQSVLPEEHVFVDRANLLGLTAPEATVLVGGLRVLGNNWDGSTTGVFTERPGQLTRDFFVNLLDLGTEWKRLDKDGHAFAGVKADGTKLIGSRIDLIFSSNSELRAQAEVWAEDDADARFIQDFVNAWVKVMDADRFDLA